MVKRAVIIGSGAAAYECVISMADNNYDGEIHVFSETDNAPYNPMLTTYYAIGKLDFAGMFPYGEGEEVWTKYGVIFHPKDPVISLDAKQKKIVSSSGLVMEFTHCLIATGASPIIPTMPGSDSKNIYTVRTVQDAQKLLEATQKSPKRVIVVGASMVGVKVLELFQKIGAEVCMADMAPYIFPLAAHIDCAKEIQKRLESQGVKLRFGAGLSAIEDIKNGVRLYFGEDAPFEEGDIAIICIGVRGNLKFIDSREFDMDRGLLVDEHMQTSVHGIYAAGDVAQGMEMLNKKRQIIGLWASARKQGRIAGANIAGKKATYKGDILHNITHFMGMNFVGIGNVSEYTKSKIIKNNQGLSMFFWRDDQLIGANFLDVYLESGVLHSALAGNPVLQSTNKGYGLKTEHTRILGEILENAKIENTR